MNNPTMPQPTPPSSHRRGFTLIELLVVVGIIAILSSLLVIGISKLRTNSKRQQTAQILQNCSAVFAEYDAIARQHYDSFDLNPGTGAIGAPGNVSTGGSDRYSAHVFLTEAVFSLMRAQPNIRASLDKFSAGKMTIPPKTPNPFMPSSYQLLSTYNPGTCVVATEPISGVSEMYLCIHNDASLSSNRLAAKPAPAAPPDSGYWMPIGGYSNNTPITDSATPILLDAWGNPIICIVGGKLSNVTAGGQKGTIVYSPDNRPFFASAGPNEDFTNGDDNMYSFEKP